MAGSAALAIDRLPPEARRELRTVLRLKGKYELARRSLWEFVRLLWGVLHPGRPLKDAWHMRVICEELERVTRGEIKRLVICIPPGMAKSMLVSVYWPAWQMLHEPQLQTLTVSNLGALAERDSDRTRTLIRSPLYQGLLRYMLACDEPPAWAKYTGGKPWVIRYDKSAVKLWRNDLGGGRECKGIDADVTGVRARQLVVDDPADAKQVIKHSPEVQRRMMKEIVDVFDDALDSRLDGEDDPKVVIMQRLHPEDLAGELLKRQEWTDNALGGQAVVLPMHYNPDAPHAYERDPRKPGELLCPAHRSAQWAAMRMPREEYDRRPVDWPDNVIDFYKARKARGLRSWVAQYEQAPRSSHGQQFNTGMFRRYSASPQALARLCEEVVISVDCASKNKAKNDETSIQIWGRLKGKRYLLGMIHGRWLYTQLKTEAAAAWEYWRHLGAQKFLVEEASNGIPLMDELKAAGIPVVGFKPNKHGGKKARANYTEGAAESDLVWIPEDGHAECPWVAVWLDQHVAFGSTGSGKESHDDHVDAASQVHVYWTVGSEKSGTALLEGIDRLLGGLAL